MVDFHIPRLNEKYNINTIIVCLSSNIIKFYYLLLANSYQVIF